MKIQSQVNARKSQTIESKRQLLFRLTMNGAENRKALAGKFLALASAPAFNTSYLRITTSSRQPRR
ncbi:hypothetical protein A6U92_23055 [Agrobacterium rubi]|nr:hypothetical protein A6U92_23055 [Agrobacterium rubi]